MIPDLWPRLHQIRKRQGHFKQKGKHSEEKSKIQTEHTKFQKAKTPTKEHPPEPEDEFPQKKEWPPGFQNPGDQEEKQIQP